MTVKEHIAGMLQQKLPTLDLDTILSMLEIPPEKEMGDYAFPCFRLAKEMRKAPALIAKDTAEALAGEQLLESVQAVGPYVNMRVNKAAVVQIVTEEYAAGHPFGSSDEGEGKTIVLDYSSINIAKPFHVGHLRSTAIGNAIHKLYRYLGYKTVRVNHLGDYGTQFGKLVVAYRKWGNKEEIEQKGIRGLLDIYVRFHKEAEQDPSLDDEARSTFTALENGDEEIREIWKWFVDISLKEVSKVYDLLDVQFDYYLGESFYMDKTDAVVKELQEKGLLEESEGAMIVDLSDCDMPPALVLKKDGSTLYTTRDLAAAIYRKKTYDFYKCLYVTGSEQSLHFSQFFKILEKMGYSWSKGLVHVPFGLMSLETGKMSTRNGQVVFLQDLLDEAIEKTRRIIEEKNPNLKDIDQVATQVGVGAVVFNDLFNSRIKDEVFAWDKVLNFDGETGPYVQYTFARASSILRKAGVDVFHPEDMKGECLSDEYAQEVLRIIEQFPEKVKEAADRYEPYVITRYAVALASAFNRFYHENAILSAEDETVRKARTALTKMMAEVLRSALSLIGVQTPEEM
ncbi:MAG: arginine--tRNA ligase [Firmicutes bacterium]|nr:arginine--tRNA ligase [Bacillota bacterium]